MNGRFSFVVHSVRTMLAPGSAGVDPISDCVAVSIAVPARWNCGGRSVEAGLGGGYAPRQIADGAVPGLSLTHSILWLVPSQNLLRPSEISVEELDRFHG